MLKLLIFSLSLLIAFALYCCIRCGSLYDKEIDDFEQENFINKWD